MSLVSPSQKISNKEGACLVGGLVLPKAKERRQEFHYRDSNLSNSCDQGLGRKPLPLIGRELSWCPGSEVIRHQGHKTFRKDGISGGIEDSTCKAKG